MKNRWNNFRIEYTSQDPYTWFNELYSLNKKFKTINGKYDKDEDDMRSHVFNVLPEEYKPLRVSFNVNI